jgi:hypothetical protein
MNSPEKNGIESKMKSTDLKTKTILWDDMEFLTGDISGCCGECDTFYLEDNCE